MHSTSKTLSNKKHFFIKAVCEIVFLLFIYLKNFSNSVKIRLPELKGILRVKGLISVDGKISLPNIAVAFYPSQNGGFFMSENRLAVISIIVEDRSESPKINTLLSEYGEYIAGRMGVPYKNKGVSVICIVIDAPMEVINTLTGKIGMLNGVTAKTLTSKK